MFKSADPSYTNRFVDQVHRFCLECALLPEDGEVVIAISGGVDSMALAHALVQIKESYGYSFGLVGVHVNHGTRKEQIAEGEMARSFCEALGIEFYGESLEGLNPYKNFEFQARKARYEILKKVVSPNGRIALGHHIDDSFEWTILQSLRSSRLDGSLGIPVRNGKVIRPFLSVTKAQIRRYCRLLDLPFLEDPTNESVRHERNYIRSQIAESFAPRYGNYLKHYVNRHNELARRLGKHISLTQNCDFELYEGKKHVEIVSFKPKFNPSGLELLIFEAIGILNPNARGSTHAQVGKIVAALRNHKSGPLSLPGGLRCYLSFNHILICKKDFQTPDRELADSLTESLERPSVYFKEFDYPEFMRVIKRVYKKHSARGDFPLFVFVKKRSFNFEPGAAHPLWPALFDAAQDAHGDLVPAIKLIKYWGKAKNQSKRLRLRLLLSL